jgi:hypothetical protein
LSLLWLTIYVLFVGKESKRKQTLILWILWNAVQVSEPVNMGCKGRQMASQVLTIKICNEKHHCTRILLLSSVFWGLDTVKSIENLILSWRIRGLHLAELLSSSCSIPGDDPVESRMVTSP